MTGRQYRFVGVMAMVVAVGSSYASQWVVAAAALAIGAILIVQGRSRT